MSFADHKTFELGKTKQLERSYGQVSKAINYNRDGGYDVGVLVRCNNTGTIIDTIKIQSKVKDSSKDYKTFLDHSANFNACVAKDASKGVFSFVLLEFNWAAAIANLDNYYYGDSVKIKIKHKSTGAGNGNTDGWTHLELRQNNDGYTEMSENGNWDENTYITDHDVTVAEGYCRVATAIFHSHDTANDVRLKFSKVDYGIYYNCD